MLDPRLLRNELKMVSERLKIKHFDLDVATFDSLEKQRKEIQISTEALQAERNTRSKKIGQAKANGEDIEPFKLAVSEIGAQLDVHQKKLQILISKITYILTTIINQNINILI